MIIPLNPLFPSHVGVCSAHASSILHTQASTTCGPHRIALVGALAFVAGRKEAVTQIPLLGIRPTQCVQHGEPQAAIANCWLGEAWGRTLRGEVGRSEIRPLPIICVCYGSNCVLQILASLLLCLGLLNSFPIHGKISPLVLMTSSLLIYPYKLLLADQISCSIMLLMCYHESELESCLLPSRVYLHIWENWPVRLVH